MGFTLADKSMWSCSGNMRRTTWSVWIRFSIFATAYPKTKASVDAKNNWGRFGLSDSFRMKGTLGSGCHLLRDSGFLLAWLHGKCLARPIPNALVNRLPHPYIFPSPGSFYNRFFIPTYSYRLPNRVRIESAIARDGGMRELLFLQSRNDDAQCERSNAPFQMILKI